MSRELRTAETIDEAVRMKNAASAYLAGGTKILRLGSSVYCRQLIMIRNLTELKGISVTEEHFVRIGSLTTFEEAAESDRVPEYFRKALFYMASRTKRNMATVGGNVALLRDDSYLGAVLIAAHAQIELISQSNTDEDGTGERRAERVCICRYLRRREEYRDALITAVLLRPDARVRSKRFANTAESHSYLTVAVGKADGRLRIGVSVKNSGLFFPEEESGRLGDGASSEQQVMEWAESWEGLDIPDDQYGSTAYKRYLLGVTVSGLCLELSGEKKGRNQSDPERCGDNGPAYGKEET